MSLQTIGDIMRCGNVLAANEKAVALALANCANEDGFSYPSVGELAWNIGKSKKTVERTIPDLEDLGFLRVVRKGDGRSSNRYWLNVDLLHDIAADIFRLKQKARQEKIDRYPLMKAKADDWREHLIAQMMADPDRRRSWLKRHPLKEKVNTPRGDKMTGVRDTKKFDPRQNVAPQPTKSRGIPSNCRPRGDIAVSPEPPKKSLIEPPEEPPAGTRGERAVENEPPPEPRDRWLGDEATGDGSERGFSALGLGKIVKRMVNYRKPPDASPPKPRQLDIAEQDARPSQALLASEAARAAKGRAA
ncbi:MAG: helix-turn-helix domain-containing protein [Pseudomonadota bacterium]